MFIFNVSIFSKTKKNLRTNKRNPPMKIFTNVNHNHYSAPCKND